LGGGLEGAWEGRGYGGGGVGEKAEVTSSSNQNIKP